MRIILADLDGLRISSLGRHPAFVVFFNRGDPR